MAFEWLSSFHRATEKPANYAEKTLAAYRLGMKAGGSIEGVTVQIEEDCCTAARALSPGALYHPDEAPRLPLASCTRGGACRCVYRPKMAYEEDKA